MLRSLGFDLGIGLGLDYTKLGLHIAIFGVGLHSVDVALTLMVRSLGLELSLALTLVVSRHV